MIFLALRLAVRGGRDAAARLAFIAAGVAVGVTLLLAALASYNGLRAQDTRSGWLATSAHNLEPSIGEPTSDPILWRRTQDEFQGQSLNRIDLAATGTRSPHPPGIPALPRTGEYYASPALVRLLTRIPANQLGDRYPGHLIGTIGQGALASPNVLIIIIGRDRTALEGQSGTTLVRSIETAPIQHAYTTFQEVALGIGAAGLLFPILTFVAMATRLDAARREQRLAAMRLVGATNAQVALIGATEAAVAALAGALSGTVLFYLLRPGLAHVSVTGDTWFTNDLSPGPLALAMVWAGVPLAAGVTAVAALRRVRLSPLGVTRRVTPPPPKPSRLVPLGLGLLILALFALAGHTYSRGASSTYAPTIVAGFVLTMAGLLVAGPWLTMACTRLLAARSARPATLIASRRLADDPAAAFRSVSGLILAVFVGSVFVAGTATASSSGALGDDPAASTTVITRPTGAPLPASTAAALDSRLRSLQGVDAVTLVRAYPKGEINGFPQGLLSCSDLAATPEIGRCDTTTQVAIMPLYSLDAGHTEPQTRWPAAQKAPANLALLPVQAVVIATDGSPTTIEAVRTTVETTALQRLTLPETLGQLSAATLRDVTQLQHLADLAILLSVLIAGCSLAVAVAGSLIERKRPFALLRLSGMPLGSLRRIVLLEAAVPLISLTTVSAGGGLLAATLLLRAVRATTIHLPGTAYYLTLLAGVLGALSLVAATLPLLRRISAPENARNE